MAHDVYGSSFNRKCKTYIKSRDGRCQTCGSHDELTVHHVDGNHRNNSDYNLITLCETCHRKIHNPIYSRKKFKKIMESLMETERIFGTYESPNYIRELLTGR